MITLDILPPFLFMKNIIDNFFVEMCTEISNGTFYRFVAAILGFS